MAIRYLSFSYGVGVTVESVISKDEIEEHESNR